MCLFGHGCRVSEPGLWRWKHVVEDVYPYIAWDESINKNRRREDVPLSAELAALLKGATPADRAQRTRRPVFPFIPPRMSFRSDRDRCNIPDIDPRGRRFSPHSARKFYETQMAMLGVPQAMVKAYLATPAACPVAISMRKCRPDRRRRRLPRLWPEPVECGPVVDNYGISTGDLTTAAGGWQHWVTSPTMCISLDNSTCPPATRGDVVGLVFSNPPRAGGQLELSHSRKEQPSRSDDCCVSSVRDQSTPYQSENAEGRTRTADLRVMNPAL